MADPRGTREGSEPRESSVEMDWDANLRMCSLSGPHFVPCQASLTLTAALFAIAENFNRPGCPQSDD